MADAAQRAGRVTRADVARAAGTSTAVVSYVLNQGSRPVAPATRERVLAAIEATGYRPNHAAQSLARGSTRTLGLLVPDISNPFFAALAHALEDEVSRHGLVLLLGDSAEDPAREAELVGNFLARQVEGLIYVGVEQHEGLQPAREAGLAVVVLDRVAEGDSASSVTIDNRAAARSATEHLLGHGAPTVALINGPEPLSTSRARLQGWRDALQHAGLAEADAVVLTSPFDKAGGYATGRRLLRTEPRPSAVFVASEEQAVGLLRAAAEAGVAVPEELAVVSFDGTEASEYSVPPLSCIAQPFAEIARRTVELLRRPEQSRLDVVCDFSLVLRRSCGCGEPPGRRTDPPAAPATTPPEDER